jgi:penicillin-binding protein 2
MTKNTERVRFEGLNGRLSWINGGFVLVVAVLVVRLAYLQIAMGEMYADQATGNRIRTYAVKSQRGIVYGRDRSVVLVSNRAAADLCLVPKECEGFEEEVCAHLENLIGVDAARLRAEIEENRAKPYSQIIVRKDITKTELTRVGEMSFALPGVFTIVRPQREYLHGSTGGQLMGWLNEIGREELDRMPGYRRGDVIGRAGIERSYESRLKGKDGRMMVSLHNMGIPQVRTDAFGNPTMALDHRGRAVIEEYREDPRAGSSMFLTLDMDLQAKAEELLEKAENPGTSEPGRGAIVVLNAETGEILTMASVPGYDPNVFVDGEKWRQRGSLLTNEDRRKRMRHRAYQEQFPPGSVFKVMMAVAGLEEGSVREHNTYYCPGHFNIGSARWACWRKQGHGSISVVDALAFSCDVYFYNLGLELGVDRIKKWGGLMGMGELTGVDLPEEITGIVPDPEWKERTHPELDAGSRRWQRGETVNLSIGQGGCSVTPLQTSVMMACVINGGRRVRPYINRDLGPEVSEPFISENTLALVQAGMRKCVEKHDFPSGTGRNAYIEGMHILGKTGTAQVVSRQVYEGMKDEEIPYVLRDHAWFVAGVVDQDPPIALTVFFEHGLHGSSGAAPLAREIIDYFYTECAPRHVQVARAEELP